MLVCRSLSQQLGLHFLTVSSEAHAAIRGVYTPRPGVRVYEVHGDLLFAGAEQVARTATRECGEFDTAILDVSRLHTISEPARALLAGLSDELRELDKQGLLVDPNGSVTPDPAAYAGLVFGTVEDALAATATWAGE